MAKTTADKKKELYQKSIELRIRKLEAFLKKHKTAFSKNPSSSFYANDLFVIDDILSDIVGSGHSVTKL